ncbi:MAG: glycosyltransferase [Muribaculaceae bacterium]|nr:glycosyltransferase [Muribaculaceae bacterium]
MSFNFDFQVYTIILLAVAALSAAIVCFYYCPFVRRVSRRRRECCLTVDTPEGKRPEWVPASIIIYAQGEADRLENLLPVILGQDYGGTFEVIVINEGDSADVRSVINALQLAHRNLYLTFTPDGARNLSRKKLALTLGIKAARYEVVVNTTADAIITSDKWLEKLMRHFNNPETGIVLGYAAPTNDSEIALSTSFCFACDSVAWIAAAIGNRAFRGTELNIAYRRQLFFENKGFSRSLNLHFGDDDIFISEIATRNNTVTELSPESVVRFSNYDMNAALRSTAIRRRFTEGFIHSKPMPRLAFGECALWLALACSGAAIALDYMNLFTIIIAALLIITPMACIAAAWKKTSEAIDLRRIFLSAPLLALAQPFRRMSLSISSGMSKQKKYTWD